MVEKIVGLILESKLKPYFENFSSENFKYSYMTGDVKMENLIFSQDITKRLNVPVKLRYGRVNSLNIKMPNILKIYNILKDGIDIEIDQVFLCFEMLELSNWSKENVLDTYQALKRHILDTFEDHMKMLRTQVKKERIAPNGVLKLSWPCIWKLMPSPKISNLLTMPRN